MGPTPGTRRLPKSAGNVLAAATPMAPPTVAPMALPMPGCSAAWVGSCASSVWVTSGVRILILSFGMPRGTSLAAALWAEARDLKTPTIGFMILSLSGRVLIGALGGVGDNRVFAGRADRSRGGLKTAATLPQKRDGEVNS